MLLEAIKAMRLRLRSEAQWCAPHRREERGQRQAHAWTRVACASLEVIASTRLLFVGQVGLQPANLAGKPDRLKLDKRYLKKKKPTFLQQADPI